jgi:hypothetical protein
LTNKSENRPNSKLFLIKTQLTNNSYIAILIITFSVCGALLTFGVKVNDAWSKYEQAQIEHRLFQVDYNYYQDLTQFYLSILTKIDLLHAEAPEKRPESEETHTNTGNYDDAILSYDTLISETKVFLFRSEILDTYRTEYAPLKIKAISDLVNSQIGTTNCELTTHGNVSIQTLSIADMVCLFIGWQRQHISAPSRTLVKGDWKRRRQTVQNILDSILDQTKSDLVHTKTTNQL